MKIIHLGNVGVSTVLSKSLCQLGHQSLVFTERPHPFGFKEDIVIFPDKIPSHFKTIMVMLELLKLRNVDVFHMHGLHRSIYFRKLKYSKAKKVFHNHSFFKDESPPPDGLFQAYFVSMPTKLKLIKNSIWIPLPVDTSSMKKIIKNDQEIIIGIGSGSADPAKEKFLMKNLIFKVVKDLQNHGKKIAIKELSGYTQQNIREYWDTVDIWIDRFNTGFYGWSTVEAASCSIPVLCQISEDVEQYIPECPFLRTEPTEKNIKSNLEYLLSNSNRESIGEKNREYVINRHDSIKVARLCLEEYSKI